MKKIIPFLLSFLLTLSAIAQLPVPFNSTGWKYYANTILPQSPPNFGTINWKLQTYNTADISTNWPSTTKDTPFGYPGSSYTATTFSSVYASGYSGSRLTTSYYRKTITDLNLQSYTSLTLNIKRDDAAIIYLNGIQVYKDTNLPSIVDHTTYATNFVGTGSTFDTDENITTPIVINGALLTSILAASTPDLTKLTITAELHQSQNLGDMSPNSSSSDAYFDVSLTGVLGAITPVITRGPYLQLATDPIVPMPASTTKQIRFKTNIPCTSKLYLFMADYSTNILDYEEVTANPAYYTSSSTFTATTDHVINLKNLDQNETYSYKIVVTQGGLSTQYGDIENKIITSPTFSAANSKTLRVWVTGDVGFSTLPGVSPYNTDPLYTNPIYPGGHPFRNILASESKLSAVKSGFESFLNPVLPLDLWILLGDNAYIDGKDEEYQRYFFNPFQSSKMMKQATLIPSLGNHEYFNNRVTAGTVDKLSRSYDYFNIFKTPKNGEAGGLPSSAPGYYSFNYSNIHFVCLDSYGTENVSGVEKHFFDVGSPQYNWLVSDLTANDSNPNIKWTIIYFHHPPYTKGTKDSDTDTELTPIRQNLTPIFEQHKVDMVMNGHSHVFERTKPIKDHTGLSSTFNPSTHVTQNISGKFSGVSCPYVQNSSNIADINGIIYVVTGSAGWIQPNNISTTLWPPLSTTHNAMHITEKLKGGSFYFEVKANRLDAKWIDEFGVVADEFTIMKDVNTNIPIVKDIKPSELYDAVPQSPASQIIARPNAWPLVTQISLFDPTGIVTGPFPPFVYSVTVNNPQIGPLYQIKDISGCLTQNYRFHFSPDCWPIDPSTTVPSVTINNTIDSPVLELIRSKGTIEAYNTVMPGSKVIYEAVRSVKLSYLPPDPSPFKFHALKPTGVNQYFIARPITTCP